MEKEQTLFRQIAEKLESENKDVFLGKMMSSPGIKYQNKVFAFYHDQEMIFKLGKDFEPESAGVKNYSFLSPFKNKPPMAGWFKISYADSDKWESLARKALQNMAESFK